MTAVYLVISALLIAANAFFVIAELAIVRVSRPRLELLARERKRGAALVLKQLDRTNDYLSASQLGITLTSIGVGALGEPVISSLFEDSLNGWMAHGLAVVVALVIAYVLISYVQSVAGEIAPKLYTMQHVESLACLIAAPMQAFMKGFRPMVSALNKSSEWLVRRLGTNPNAATDLGTTEELKQVILDSSRSGGALDIGEAEMLSGVFHLHEQEARQVMTPIPAIVTVGAEDTVEHALRQAIQAGHSRLVVIEDEDEDRVKGTVHVNQLAKLMLEQGPEAHFASRVHAAPIVPETKPLDDLLAELQHERTELAIVVDEYGRTAGIVTTEDIVEEVVGEITDETDPAAGAIRRLANGEWFVRGHVPIADLEDYGLKLPVDTDAYNSVGGLVFDELGRLPRHGDSIQINGYQIRVESVRENRIEAVRIKLREQPKPVEEPAE